MSKITLDDPDTKKAVELYRDGATLQAAAEAIDMTATGLKYRFKVLEIPLRSKQLSPELVEKIRQGRRGGKTFRWLFHNNFSPGDYVITLTFANVVDKVKAQKEFSNYIKRLRRLYKRFGLELKYLYVYEGRSNGTRPHFHVVLNSGSGLNRDDIEKLWKLGLTQARMLRSEDGSGICTSLCEYLAKEMKQASKYERSWNCSTNLTRRIKTDIPSSPKNTAYAL